MKPVQPRQFVDRVCILPQDGYFESSSCHGCEGSVDPERSLLIFSPGDNHVLRSA